MKITIFGNTMTLERITDKIYKESTLYNRAAKLIGGKSTTVLKALPGSLVDNGRRCIVTADGVIYGEDEMTFNTVGACKCYNDGELKLYRLK